MAHPPTARAAGAHGAQGVVQLSITDGATLIVKQTGQESLRVVTDDNLIDQVRAEVQDGKLRGVILVGVVGDQLFQRRAARVHPE